MLRIFEIKKLRIIYGPIKENGIWRSRYNQVLYKLYKEQDVVKVINIEWLGKLLRMQEQNPCKS
jgi:hypothetical protein